MDIVIKPYIGLLRSMYKRNMVILCNIVVISEHFDDDLSTWPWSYYSIEGYPWLPADSQWGGSNSGRCHRGSALTPRAARPPAAPAGRE